MSSTSAKGWATGMEHRCFWQQSGGDGSLGMAAVYRQTRLEHSQPTSVMGCACANCVSMHAWETAGSDGHACHRICTRGHGQSAVLHALRVCVSLPWLQRWPAADRVCGTLSWHHHTLVTLGGAAPCAQLPNGWLWDMVDEFVYQFQSWQQYRGKLSTKGPAEIEALRGCGRVWAISSVLNYLQALVDKSGICAELAAPGARVCSGLLELHAAARRLWQPGLCPSPAVHELELPRKKPVAGMAVLVTIVDGPAVHDLGCKMWYVPWQNCCSNTGAVELGALSESRRRPTQDGTMGLNRRLRTGGHERFYKSEGYDAGTNVLRMVGYFSLTGLLRVHTLVGDYAGALASAGAVHPFQRSQPLRAQDRGARRL